MVKEKIANTQPKDSIILFCEKWIFYILVFTIFIIPLFFNIYSYDQFELPKLTFLRILTLIMLVLWGIKISVQGYLDFKSTPLDIPMFLWIFLNIICTFTSFAPYLSFRGEYENFAGSLSNINYVILYYIATQNLTDKKQIIVINYSFLLAGLLSGIYAVAQFFGYDFIKWNEESMIKGRYFASMGNPNFLGALLIMIIPVNIAFFVTNINKKNYFYAMLLFFLFVLLYVALFGTQSRGPFLGFIFSVILLLSYFIYKAYKKMVAESKLQHISFLNILKNFLYKYKYWVISIVFILILSVALSLTIGKNATLRLWNSIVNFQQSVRTSRLHIWIPSLKIIKNYPILGTGVDTFKSVFPKYSGIDFAQIDGANVASRTAHNELLNIAATMGIVSLGIYLLLIFSYYRMWYRSFINIVDFDHKMISIAMFASFIAYFVQNFFSFGVAAINTSFYIFMALHFIYYKDYCNVKIRKLQLPAYNEITKIFYILIFIFSGIYFSIKAFNIYEADTYYNRGRILGSVYNKWEMAIPEHLKSIKLAPKEVKYQVYTGLAYERLAMNVQDKNTQSQLMRKAIEYYTNGIKLNPFNAYYWGNLARVYAFLGDLENNQQYLAEAEKYYLKAIDRAPVTGLFYNNLIDLYIRHGLVAQAMPLFEKLEIIDKNMAANAYFMLGNLFFTKKEFLHAENAYKKTIELNNKLFQAFHNLGVVCAALGKKSDAKLYLEKFIEMAPDSDMVPNAKKILNDIKNVH
ncbi:MAG: O-antigen ligase family protein [Candidatus Goldbacteria bacterium]|nr:O-antigen ligase family protein [Candidatus Goldiibacteriota bacterium]